MAAVDINLHSFNGPDHNDQLHEMWDDIVPGPEIADTIKCSTGLTLAFLRFGTVYAGYEDALDVNNRCLSLDIRAAKWVLDGAKTGITIKGGSQNIWVMGEVVGHGKECDVDLGNWSDQSNAKTTGTHLNLWRADGGPIRVRVLNADRPVILGGGPYEWVFPSPNIWLHDFLVKSFLTVRKVFS